MALIRIAVGLVMLWDLAQVRWLGLVIPLLGTEGAGGLSATLRAENPAPWALWMPDAPISAKLLYAGLFGTTLLYTMGLFTRPAMLGFVLLSAQWEWLQPGSSRGIESAIRITLLILMCSRCDAWLSVRALRETGSVWGTGASVPAWPRHLQILQLVLMYFLAGIQKFGLDWSPAHGFTALYLITQDPSIANAPYGWLEHEPWLLLTRIGTAVTMAWEWGTPLLLLVYWYRFTPDLPGRLRAWSNNWQPQLWWAAIGLVFHVGIALLLALGIFPWAMLSMYFCILHPDQLKGLAPRELAHRLLRARSTSARRSPRDPSKAAR